MTRKNNENGMTVKGEAAGIAKDFAGSDEWQGGFYKKLGWLTGASSISRAGGSISRMLRPGISLILGGFLRIIRRAPVQTLKTDSQDPVERFRVAQSTYEASDDDVAQQVVRSGRQALTYIALTMLMTLWALSLIPDEPTKYGWFIDYVSPWTVHPFLLPFTIRACFWNWQLRTRRLCSLREFASSPGEWLPSVSRVTKIALVLVTLGAAMLAFPDLVFAADVPRELAGGGMGAGLPGFEAIPGSDLYMRTLGAFLGGIGPIPQLVGDGSPWITPMGAAFRVFNSTLLAVGGTMLGWQTIAGMVATAHEGQVLGQKWHTMWAPVRVTAGVGTLVPIAGGFSAIQIFVLHLAVWSTSFANTVWYGFIDTMGSTAYVSSVNTGDRRDDYSSAIFALSRDEHGRNLVLGMFEKNVCLLGMKASADQYIGSYIAQTGTEIGSLINLSSEQMGQIFGEKMFARNLLARAGMNVTDPMGSSPQLDLAEVGSGRVSHFVGLNRDGVITSDPVTTWPSAITPRQGWNPLSEPVSEATPVTVWEYGDICGRVTLDFSDLALVESYLQNNSTSQVRMDAASGVLFAAASNAGTQIDAQVMEPLRAAAQHFVRGVLQPGSIANLDAYRSDMLSKDGEVTRQIAIAYARYIQIIEQTRARLAQIENIASPDDEQDRMIRIAKELGWSSSGAFYVVLSRMAENAVEVSQIDVHVSDPKYHKIDRSYRDDIYHLWHTRGGSGLINEVLNFKKIALVNTFITGDPDAAANAVIQVQDEIEIDGIWDYVQSKLNKVSRTILYPILVESFQVDPYSALIHMIDLGHMFISVSIVIGGIATAVYVASVAAESFLAAGKQIPLLGNLAGGADVLVEAVAGTLLAVLKILGIVMLAAGLVHAYIIPMMPFVFVSFAVTGMLILVGEALIAAPIWALLHVRMDGAEFVDNPQRQGYQIAFNIFLRPALTVFGLVLSLGIYSASIYFLSEAFNIAAAAAMPDSKGVAAIGVVSMMLIQLYLHYQLAIRCFSLITQIPDRVLRWMGVGSEGLNEDGDSNTIVGFMNRESEGRITQGAGALSMARGKQKPGGDSDIGGSSDVVSSTPGNNRGSLPPTMK